MGKEENRVAKVEFVTLCQVPLPLGGEIIDHYDFKYFFKDDNRLFAVRKAGLFLSGVDFDEIDSLKRAFGCVKEGASLFTFPTIVAQVRTFAGLMPDCINQKRLEEVTAAKEEIQHDAEQHAFAIERDDLEDKITLGKLSPTVEDTDAEDLFFTVSGLVSELNIKLENSPTYTQGGRELFEQSCSVLYQLLLVEQAETNNDKLLEWEALKQTIASQIFAILEREALFLPQGDETRQKLAELGEKFSQKRQPGSYGKFGKEVDTILRENIDSQTGPIRKFLTWRKVVSKLEKLAEIRDPNSCVCDIKSEDDTTEDGEIFLKNNKKPVTFSALRKRLTNYRSTIQIEYRLKNIEIL